jgi:hypothetical protein
MGFLFDEKYAQDFTLFGWLHILVLLVGAGGIVLMYRLRGRLSRPITGRIFRYTTARDRPELGSALGAAILTVLEPPPVNGSAERGDHRNEPVCRDLVVCDDRAAINAREFVVNGRREVCRSHMEGEHYC